MGMASPGTRCHLLFVQAIYSQLFIAVWDTGSDFIGPPNVCYLRTYIHSSSESWSSTASTNYFNFPFKMWIEGRLLSKKRHLSGDRFPTVVVATAYRELAHCSKNGLKLQLQYNYIHLTMNIMELYV